MISGIFTRCDTIARNRVSGGRKNKMATPNLQVELAVSNMDLYPYTFGSTPNWGSNLEEMAPFLAQTGFRNYEIHPTRRVLEDVTQTVTVEDCRLAASLVGSMHQTFNSGGGVFGWIADNRGVSRIDNSVLDMKAMQLSLARQVPVVVYPESLPEGLVPLVKMGLTAMQPKAEDYVFFHNRFGDLRHEVYLNAGLIEANDRIGVRYLCPDTVHSRRRGQHDEPIPDVEDVWGGQFASGKVVQVHVSANRVDMKKRDPEIAARSHAEFGAFVSGNWRSARATQMGQMIVEAINTWVPPEALDKPVLRMVAEIPPVPINYRSSIVQHARFAETLAEIARDAGASLLMYGD